MTNQSIAIPRLEDEIDEGCFFTKLGNLKYIKAKSSTHPTLTCEQQSQSILVLQ